MKSIFDNLAVGFDSSEKDGSALCVLRKDGNQFTVLKMELGEQADILYHLLTEQMTKAEIKAESEGKALEQEPRWIPVSERLPKGYCLFCDIDGDVFYGHIYDKKWWAEGQDDRIKNVIAWMPTPEPYKAESEEV